MDFSSRPAAVAATWAIPLPTVVLRGRLVELAPLCEADIPGVADAAADPAIWTYMTSDACSPERAHAYVDELLSLWKAGSALPFAVRRLDSPAIIGVTRLKDVVRLHRRMAIGSWLAPAVWATGANTEAKLLLFEHACERLGALRVELETDARNARSLAALQKIGATREGTLRSHRITRDGHRRDSVVFSVLDQEWPSVRQRLDPLVEQSLRRDSSVSPNHGSPR